MIIQICVFIYGSNDKLLQLKQPFVYSSLTKCNRVKKGSVEYMTSYSGIKSGGAGGGDGDFNWQNHKCMHNPKM